MKRQVLEGPGPKAYTVLYTPCRAGKVTEFGENFKATILINREAIKIGKTISGEVAIETRSPLKHKGLIIQFEALCMLRYTTKLDGVTRRHQARECIFAQPYKEWNEWKGGPIWIPLWSDGLPESPIRQTIVPDESVPHTINPGCTVYPFTLEMPGDLQNLPAPFKNNFNRITYRLTVYMRSSRLINQACVEVGERTVQFGGYYNLQRNSDAVKPILIEKYFLKSILSRKKLVEVKFSIEASGFLPGERIPFKLEVNNRKCIPMQVSVQLVQQIKIDAGGEKGSALRKVVIVASKEKEESKPQPEMEWVDYLTLGESLEPTFTEHTMYNVSYTLEFKVKVQDLGTIKGNAPIYIGTTRASVEELMMAARSTLDIPSSEGLRRRSWDSSTYSIGSVITMYSLPPAYSQLSSRRSSMETLPPEYNEVALLEHIKEISLQDFHQESLEEGLTTPVAEDNNADGSDPEGE